MGRGRGVMIPNVNTCRTKIVETYQHRPTINRTIQHVMTYSANCPIIIIMLNRTFWQSPPLPYRDEPNANKYAHIGAIAHTTGTILTRILQAPTQTRYGPTKS